MGMEENDPLPVNAALLTSSMFVGDVIAGHGLTAFLEAAESAGCKTANGGHMVEAAQDVMADFMLRKTDSPTGRRQHSSKVIVLARTIEDESRGRLEQVSGNRSGKPACP
jgi:shikimate 5-dehydrogenase